MRLRLTWRQSFVIDQHIRRRIRRSNDGWKAEQSDFPSLLTFAFLINPLPLCAFFSPFSFAYA